MAATVARAPVVSAERMSPSRNDERGGNGCDGDLEHEPHEVQEGDVDVLNLDVDDLGLAWLGVVHGGPPVMKWNAAASRWGALKKANVQGRR